MQFTTLLDRIKLHSGDKGKDPRNVTYVFASLNDDKGRFASVSSVSSLEPDLGELAQESALSWCVLDLLAQCNGRLRYTTVSFIVSSEAVKVSIAMPFFWNAVTILTDEIGVEAFASGSFIFTVDTIFPFVTDVDAWDTDILTTVESVVTFLAVHFISASIAISESIANKDLIDASTIVTLDFISCALWGRGTTINFIFASCAFWPTVTYIVFYNANILCTVEEVLGASCAIRFIKTAIAITESVA